jgi:hypothetical protein
MSMTQRVLKAAESDIHFLNKLGLNALEAWQNLRVILYHAFSLVICFNYRYLFYWFISTLRHLMSGIELPFYVRRVLRCAMSKYRATL